MKNLVQNITSIWNKHIHRALAAPRLRLFALLFACGASLGFAFAQSGKRGENLTWTLENGVLTISGTGSMQDFDFNDTTSWHYNRTSISSVVINEGVTSIGKYAFSGCSALTAINIPSSVTIIGDDAFYGCSRLTSPVYNNHVFAYLPENYSGTYAIPNGIETIAGSAFSGCKNLTSITIPNSVKSIGDYAFSCCTGLKSITIPNSVTSIGDWAFFHCEDLTSVTISNSVTSIGYRLFCGCNSLTSVTIQDIQFKEYEDESCRFDKEDEEYSIYTTDIIWPISGLPADKLHSLRLCLLDALAPEEVALSAKVDDANFPATLHKAMYKHSFIDSERNKRLKYIPCSKVPPSDGYDSRVEEVEGMELGRATNGIYTFFFSRWFSMNPGLGGDDLWSALTLNYDVERNRPLALNDILQVDMKAEINRIYRYLVNQWLIDNGKWEEDFDEDPDYGNVRGWFVSDEGIEFVFNPGELPGTYKIDGVVEVTLPLCKYKHLFRPEVLKYWANCVQPSMMLSSELDAANERISQIVQQHNEVINRSPYTQYLNKNERNRYLHTYSPFQIPKAYDYDQAKAFCDSLQRVADSLSHQDPASSIASIKDYLRTTRPDDYVAAYLKENPTAKAHLESEHKEYRCHYASFTDFVLQYEQGRLQPTERNCRELKWQEYNQYYSNKEAFNTDYDKGDEHLEAHKRHYELKWAEYKQYYSSREAFDADYHLGDATLEIHKKREIKWAECADYYEARYMFDFDYDKGETVVDAHRRRIDEAWSSLQQLPEELLVKKKLIGASESKKEDILNLFSLYRQLKPSPHFQSLAADFLISRNKKMNKEYEKNGAYFSSKIAFLTAYFSGDYKHIIKSLKK